MDLIQIKISIENISRKLYPRLFTFIKFAMGEFAGIINVEFGKYIHNFGKFLLTVVSILRGSTIKFVAP